jgi:opacity protein-like surface antigen
MADAGGGGLHHHLAPTGRIDLDLLDAERLLHFSEDSGFHGGWALGGGWEQRLTERLSLKAEYLYMDFGSSTSSSQAGDIYKHDNELHTARLGINWHLDAHCGNCDSTK